MVSPLVPHTELRITGCSGVLVCCPWPQSLSASKYLWDAWCLIASALLPCPSVCAPFCAGHNSSCYCTLRHPFNISLSGSRDCSSHAIFDQCSLAMIEDAGPSAHFSMPQPRRGSMSVSGPPWSSRGARLLPCGLCYHECFNAQFTMSVFNHY